MKITVIKNFIFEISKLLPLPYDKNSETLENAGKNQKMK